MGMKLTALIQEMIKTNEETKKELEATREDFKELESVVYEQTSDKKIIDLMLQNFIKSPYFTSVDFFQDVAKSLIDKYGLGNLVTLDKQQTQLAIHEFLVENFNIDSIIQHLLNHYNDELRDAMIKRIRIESKSILDNYDFTYTIMPRLEEYLQRFMAEHNLTQYLIEQTSKLFVAQQSNLNFMLEYYTTKQLESEK